MVLDLNLFRDVSFRALREHQEPTAHGVSWAGKLEGYPMSDAVFVLVDDVLVGHIYAPFGFFRIERGGDGVYLVQQIDQSLLEGPNDDSVIPPAGVAPSAALNITAPADSSNQLDVMVVYTPDVLRGWGGVSQARAAIDLALAETNQALRNTGVNTSFRLVHSREVSYTETGNSDTDLGRLRVASDGYLDAVRTLRDQYAADFVVLIVEAMTDACGRGYVSAVDGSEPHGLTGFPEYAYSVVARGCLRGGRTLPHELGHNMGAEHDWYVSGSDRAAYNYAYGYTSRAGRFLDIMSYYDLCRAQGLTCAQLLQYSNPRVQSGGYPTGVAAGTYQGARKASSTRLTAMLTLAAPSTTRLGSSRTTATAPPRATARPRSPRHVTPARSRPGRRAP